MLDLGLAPHEGIIMQCDDIHHNNKRAKFFLTNLNLICAEEKGVFRTTYNIFKFPTNQIKVVNERAQVFVNKVDEEWVLQVLFQNGKEEFEFTSESFFDKNKKKQLADRCLREINQLLVGRSDLGQDDGTIVTGAKSILGALGFKTKTQEPERATGKCVGCMAPITGRKGQNIKCKYCDTNQTL